MGGELFSASLGIKYIDQLYFDRRYRTIITHKNFNPRLISYITDSTRLETCQPNSYWDYIVRSLANPSQVWENPFNAQQDDFGRAIILLVVLNGNALKEKDLSEAYHRFVALPENQNLRGIREFQSNIRLLTGSFLNRIVSSDKPPMIDLFNPSIGDYVLKRYAGDIVLLRLGFQSLRTLRSTITLRSLQGDGLLSKADTKALCYRLIENLAEKDFDCVSVSYISALCDVYRNCGGFKSAISEALRSAVQFIINEGLGEATDDSFQVVKCCVKQRIISPEQALDFIANNVDSVESHTEMRAISSLLLAIPEETREHREKVKLVKEHVLNVVSENLSEFIDVNSAFSNIERYDDYRTAEHELEKLIKNELIDLGLIFCTDDIIRILESYDVQNELHSYFENYNDGYDHSYDGPEGLAIDEIDDLFERN